MAKKNVKAEDTRFHSEARLAGGQGQLAAVQDAKNQLRRSVMANLLWEKQFYEDGESVVDNIRTLIPQVEPSVVSEIAVEARTKQKLRHVPLLLAREMARLKTHRAEVGRLLPQIILRADELAEFTALYWADGKGQPLSKQVKIGLSKAFENFDSYQFAKYRGDGKQVRLRDVMFLTHPKPPQDRIELYKQVADDTLPPPKTWEVLLSAGKNKKESFTDLIESKQLGALAFLRNLRLMGKEGVERAVIQKGFDTINPRWLLPLNYFAAQHECPEWTREIETLMFRALEKAPKLPGLTFFVVDVSGSMNEKVSEKSDYSRLDVACVMATMAAEMCEHILVYATSGSDSEHQHKTALVKPYRGFAMADEIRSYDYHKKNSLGGGGIFTRQCLEYIREHSQNMGTPSRIIVFSDSQDCDLPNRRAPKPFGAFNYIVDVSAHQYGVNYKGVWTAEISGWSEHFMDYIAAYEGLSLEGREQAQEQEAEEQ